MNGSREQHVARFLDQASEGTRRLHLPHIGEWMRLRSCELELTRFLVVVPTGNEDVDWHATVTCSPRRIATAVRDYGPARAAAFLFAHREADSVRQADDTILWLLGVWERGERVVTRETVTS